MGWTLVFWIYWAAGVIYLAMGAAAFYFRWQMWNTLGRRQPRVFVSYRRRDVPQVVRRMVGHLSQEFGDSNVFQDENDIKAGDRFDDRIQARIAEIDALLVVIGPNFLAATKTEEEVGEQLAEEMDWVSREVEQARSQNWTKVTPVFVDGEPDFEHLPQSIKELKEHHAVSLSGGSNDEMAVGLGQIKEYCRSAARIDDTYKAMRTKDMVSQVALSVVPIVLLAVALMGWLYDQPSDVKRHEEAYTQLHSDLATLKSETVPIVQRTVGRLEAQSKVLPLSLDEMADVSRQVEAKHLLPDGDISSIYGYYFQTDASLDQVKSESRLVRFNRVSSDGSRGRLLLTCSDDKVLNKAKELLQANHRLVRVRGTFTYASLENEAKFSGELIEIFPIPKTDSSDSD